MFDYLLDRLSLFHNELLNEVNFEIRKCLISIIRCILKKLPKEFDEYACTFDINDGN